MRLIDADKLIRTEFYNIYRSFTGKDVRKAIRKAPTVDAVIVVHGFDTNTDRYFHCSICGYGVADVYESADTKVKIFDSVEDKEWNYCPNCGAKMDGERKDDE